MSSLFPEYDEEHLNGAERPLFAVKKGTIRFAYSSFEDYNEETKNSNDL
jgi:hypothetical protein